MYLISQKTTESNTRVPNTPANVTDLAELPSLEKPGAGGVREAPAEDFNALVGLISCK